MLGSTAILAVRITTGIVQLMALLGHLALLGAGILRSVAAEFRTGKRLVAAECGKHVYECGVQTLVPISGIAVFLGILATVESISFLSSLSNTETASRIVMTLVVRDLAPLLTMFVLVGKAGSHYAGQIALMQSGQEIDALRSVGINPLYYSVFPRVLALTASAACLAVFFLLAFLLSGALISETAYGLGFTSYLAQMLRSVSPVETVLFPVKCALFGFLIGLCCCHFGLRATRAVVEIPRLTSRAAFSAIALCVFANLFLTLVFHYKNSLL